MYYLRSPVGSYQSAPLGLPGLKGASAVGSYQSAPLGLPGLKGASGYRGYIHQPIAGHYLHQPLFPSTTTTTSTTTTPKLVDMLPWLASKLNPNGTLTIGQDVYELGDFSYPMIIIQKPCLKTPFDATQTGTCSTLPRCPDVYSNLTNFSIYQQYFCAIETTDKKYAGVCCPLRNQKNDIF
ncbi:uncharacterized protein LOC108913917 [Anoplophora glabripennis]|uniref:uncharacterized protein LOC108913917 n=1 Tax=Anoplophora glabripennis TaxID=217634 RepID=UPI000874BDCC|nr:uncharacterized protein LOC108913917 [Anoplophora glabripennis]